MVNLCRGRRNLGAARWEKKEVGSLNTAPTTTPFPHFFCHHALLAVCVRLGLLSLLKTNSFFGYVFPRYKIITISSASKSVGKKNSIDFVVRLLPRRKEGKFR